MNRTTFNEAGDTQTSIITTTITQQTAQAHGVLYNRDLCDLFIAATQQEVKVVQDNHAMVIGSAKNYDPVANTVEVTFLKGNAWGDHLIEDALARPDFTAHIKDGTFKNFRLYRFVLIGAKNFEFA